MTLAKLYVVRSFRALVARHPSAQVAVFVDDVIVAADSEGDRVELQRTIVDAAADVVQIIQEELGTEVALHKAAVVASHAGIAAAVVRQLRLPPGALVESAVM